MNDAIARKIINALADKGQKLIQKAFNESDYSKDKTQNLHDSYGSAVFYNGKLVVGSERYFISKAVEGKYNSSTNKIEYGRDEIESFFQNYKAKSRGFELVIAVAMFYGEILESGSGNLRRKYKVISSVADDVEMLASKLNGARVKRL